MDVGAVAALGTALSSARLEMQLATFALSAQLDAMQDLGQQTVRLIQAAALEPGTGTVLDVQV